MTNSFDRDPTAHPSDLPELDTNKAADAAVGLGSVGLDGLPHPAAEGVLTAPTELPAASEFADLRPLIRTNYSIHYHRNNERITVYAHARTARQTEVGDRTGHQRRVLADVEAMKRYAPYSFSFEEVYTPTELRALVRQIEPLNANDRTSVLDVESKIMDTILASPEGDVPDNLRRSAQRVADGNAEIGKLPWATFIRMAGLAGAVLRDRILVNPDLRPYVISLVDPSPIANRDLSPVYQYVASSHAYDVFSQRTTRVRAVRVNAYTANCDTINQWMSTHAAVVDRLPLDFSLDGRVSAAWKLRNLVEAMNTRLTSTDRTGRDKAFAADPHGALQLQRLIALTVDQIKQKLAKDSEPDEDEIIPLD